MKALKTIFNTIFILALLAVIALFLLPILPLHTGIEIKIVKSGSMEPAVRTGGIVVIRPSSEYKVGDIVTFGSDSKTSVPTTHRIVSLAEHDGATYMATKGDANEKPDPEETDTSQIIGKVMLTVPFAGYILDFARQPVGFILLIGVPAGLVILYELFGIIEEARKLLARRRMRSD